MNLQPAKNLAEIDCIIFDDCLKIASKIAPSHGPAMRWCLALGYFKGYTGRGPRFDVNDAWNRCRLTGGIAHPSPELLQEAG